MSAEPAGLDPTAAERLKRIGGDRLLRAMLRSFLENAEQRMAAAREAAARGEVETIRDEAHALKSSAGNIGATRLQHAAAQVERQADEPGAIPATLIEILERAWPDARDAAGALLRSVEAEEGEPPQGRST